MIELDNRKIEIINRMIMDYMELHGIDLYSIPEDQIDSIIRKVISNSRLDIDDDGLNKIKKEFEYRYNIRQSEGESIEDDYEHKRDWYTLLMEKKDHSEEYFWKRYRDYLIREVKLNLNIVNLLDNNTLVDLMNYLGNPTDSTDFFRRGLVIGDVQSGKTSTYTGLICKAADAGYRVIILLTGVTETLRSQTQKRMEEGIIGMSITGLKGKGKGKSKSQTMERVGVGKNNGAIKVTAMTSLEYDFTGSKDQITTSLENHKLVMFIVKKNTRVLNKLYTWLHELNMDFMDKKIHYPMLMIDDESDNASINTNKEEEDPTKTNEIIRKLVHVFTKTSYVGFTATPYANVFINPDTTEDEMLKDDLFPRNFIYVLKSPSNYIGASQIFSKDGKYRNALKWIQDIEEPDNYQESLDFNRNNIFHFRHRKEWNGDVPDSLIDSVYTFLLANVIRDLRGDSSEPRTMMINMSRFTRVQGHIKDEIETIYNDAYNDIKIDFSNKEDENRNLPLYKDLRRCWDNNYKDIDIKWEDAIRKENLLLAIENIEIVTVNSNKDSGKLDYKKNPRLRVIAIGGLALSRGLTLEGLLVSYFYRNTATFDVLMQMGRWFGYRKSYEDIFRIWISKKSADWYCEIVEATDELKDSISKMREAKLTPENFGLRVRDESLELKITAANKMRHAVDQVEMLDFYGQVFDTPYLDTDIEKNIENRQKTSQFINLVINDNFNFNRNPDAKNLYFSHDIPVQYIIHYLEDISIPPNNIRFDTEQILEFLNDSNDEVLKKWDVVLIGKGEIKENDEREFEASNNIWIAPVVRSFDLRNDRVNIGGRRARLTSPTDARNGLTKLQIEHVKEMIAMDGATDRKTLPREAWFRYTADRNPLLMIYFIRLDDDGLAIKEKCFLDKQGTEPLIGLSIGFPKSRGSILTARTRKYKVNKIYNRPDEEDNEEDIEYEE